MVDGGASYGALLVPRGEPQPLREPLGQRPPGCPLAPAAAAFLRGRRALVTWVSGWPAMVGAGSSVGCSSLSTSGTGSGMAGGWNSAPRYTIRPFSASGSIRTTDLSCA